MIYILYITLFFVVSNKEEKCKLKEEQSKCLKQRRLIFCFKEFL